MAAKLGLCTVAEPTDVPARPTPGQGERYEAAQTPAARRRLVEADSCGWDTPTAAGLEAEAAVRATGALLAERAHELAAPALDSAKRRFTEPDRRVAVTGVILANAYGAAVAEIRPMGPGREGVRTLHATRSLARLLSTVCAHYPRDWIATSNAAHERTEPAADAPHGLYLTRHPSRGSYDSASTITRTLPGRQPFSFTADVLYVRNASKGWRGRGYAVACHELAHRFEHLLPRIGELTRVFVARRAIDPDTGRRQPLVSYPDGVLSGPAHADRVDHSEIEWVQPSGLIDGYMGKIYRNRQYHEILSTGMEALFAGAYGGLAGTGDYRADPEHRDFVLGLLALV